MNKIQRQLIKQAKPYELGTRIDSILIIPTGKLYIDTYTKESNGYETMHLLAQQLDSKECYLIPTSLQIDAMVFLTSNHVRAIDIPADTGSSIRLQFNKPITLIEFHDAIVPISFNQFIKDMKGTITDF